jgi:hypothetical protein
MTDKDFITITPLGFKLNFKGRLAADQGYTRGWRYFPETATATLFQPPFIGGCARISSRDIPREDWKIERGGGVREEGSIGGIRGGGKT